MTSSEQRLPKFDAGDLAFAIMAYFQDDAVAGYPTLIPLGQRPTIPLFPHYSVYRPIWDNLFCEIKTQLEPRHPALADIIGPFDWNSQFVQLRGSNEVMMRFWNWCQFIDGRYAMLYRSSDWNLLVRHHPQLMADAIAVTRRQMDSAIPSQLRFFIDYHAL
ncbi:MAG TPA: hypothetical protein VG866_02140 [Candidatus Paceibacterota bacterium]|nr:hypothetical protein [Candidatus Paceibacterota bacterium]